MFVPQAGRATEGSVPLSVFETKGSFSVSIKQMNEPSESRQRLDAVVVGNESNNPGSGLRECEPLLSPERVSPAWRTLWILFICAIVGSFFAHEIGHCTVAWLHGYAAIPTPAKEYVLSPIPQGLQNQVALGGVLGSVAAVLVMLFLVHHNPSAIRSALLAGAMTAPGCYMLRFILFGRGHDAEEFQEAQAALGFSYGGHALDWLFLGLFAVASAFWFWRARRPFTLRHAGRLIAGSVVAVIVVVLLQSVNNAIFDPLFAATK